MIFFASKFIKRFKQRIHTKRLAFEKLWRKNITLEPHIYTVTITSKYVSEYDFFMFLGQNKEHSNFWVCTVCVSLSKSLVAEIETNVIKCHKMLSFQQIKHCFNKFDTIWNICKQICIKFFQFVAILFNCIKLQFPTLCQHLLSLSTVRNHKFDILSVYLCL